VNPPSESDFADADLARLETLLADEALRESALPPDAMQGLFCALAMGPQPAPAADAVDAALGVEDGASSVPAPALRELVTRFHDETVRAVAHGTLSPLLYELRRGRLDYRTWCRGFLEGVDRAEPGWYESADPDEVAELLFPIHVVADDLHDDERRSYRPAEWRRLLLDSEARLPDTILRIRDYWAIVRTPPQTLRREGEKVGRNDPCPCGSGRKYKLCHGR
jgi:uncharacterized protein